MSQEWQILSSYQHFNIPNTLTITPHYGEHIEAPTETVDQQTLEEIRRGDTMFMTLGKVVYIEPSNRPDVEFCALWGSRPDKTIMKCSLHNEE